MDLILQQNVALGNVLAGACSFETSRQMIHFLLAEFGNYWKKVDFHMGRIQGYLKLYF